MRIPAWLTQFVKSGEVSLFKNGKKIVELEIEGQEFTLNLEEASFLENLLKIGVKPEKKSIIKMLREQRKFAEKLREDGLTITISHKGIAVLKLGAGANPRFTRWLTFTKAIEVKSLGKLIEMLKELK
ncbi:hypothetical protein [Candidatus Hecatella orcuttiae]|uniref:hypothetical protein n=1 Tax=Candidatus Hecatella orcuttiae TaxID=1935119 RepID=UPI002867C26D|nr:hypothetical protein [Candidatus Hecatella orcuttiae]